MTLLQEKLAAAKANMATRLAEAEAARTKLEVSTPKAEPPKAEYRPRNLSVEVDADQIIPHIVASLDELPETLDAALASLPELKAVIDEAAATANGLMGALEKRYAPLFKRQERRKKITAFKNRIADLPTERLPYGLARELVEFEALVEIPGTQNDEIQAANKAARDKKGKMTFVRQSLEKDKGGAVVATHYYLETEEWLADAFRAHHVALKRSERTWQEHLAKLGISGTNDFRDALLRIAMGEKLAAVAYLPYERRLKIDGREVFGKYLVEGIDPDGNVPQMIFTELEGGESLDECESPMYFATRGLAGGVFQFRPLMNKGRMYLAFAGLQEKSGKPFGLAKKLLMSSLGVEERKRGDRPPLGQRISGPKPTYSSGSGAHKPTLDVAVKAAVSPPVPAKTPTPTASDATPKPARKARREQERKQREPRPETKERGGAGSDEAARAMRGELSAE